MSEPAINLPQEPSVSQPTVPQPPSGTSIFRGPNGIRAGWRVLIFLAIVAGLVAAVNLVVWLVLHFLLHHAPQFGTTSSLSPATAVLSDGAIFVFTGLAALIMSRIEHRKWREYGLPVRFAFRQHFWLGTLAGFLAISASLLAIFALRGFHLAGLAIHGKTILTATAAWTAAFVIVGLGEEFAFRGYLQFTLTTGMGFWPAAILLSALFGLAHAANPGESKFGLFSVVCFGLLFCLFLRRTGNLWWAVGFHAGWDWGQTFFYGVTDSGLAPYHNLFNSSFSGPTWLTGGSVGPEASIFTPLTLLVVGMLFTRVYREKRYQPLGKA
ncbi:MAG TPA: type II CAAX endopeptidase family protein [Candidatus Acidoferrum sp.]|jgi:membrane protease YdiL (CAAX protease family)|nr:type II CAAX endopeptidase family protein [Candidatus Acidoferrum sp.]